MFRTSKLAQSGVPVTVVATDCDFLAYLPDCIVGLTDVGQCAYRTHRTMQVSKMIKLKVVARSILGRVIGTETH